MPERTLTRALLATLLIAFGCSSSSELKLDAPAEAIADGITPIVIKASAKFRGTPLANGQRVKLRTTAGSLYAGTTPPSTTVQEIELSATGGDVQANLLPPKTAQEATLVASFTNANREAVSTEKNIKFVFAPPADARTLSVACVSSCLSALTSSVPALTLSCSLNAKTPSGVASPASEAMFLAEAGLLTDLGPAADGSRRLAYIVTPGTARPADVVPVADENDFTTIDGAGLEKNPRDMVVTLLAAVKVQEDFTDFNGNGRYDEDEPFVDEPEPFVDVDDDAVFTVGVDRTIPALDVNGNGEWDNGNGVYDTSVWAGRSTRVIWAGDGLWRADQAALNLVSPGGPTSGTLQLVFVDEFGNPPCGHVANDAVVLSLSSTPNGLSATGLGTTPLTAELGLLFNPNGSFADLQRDGNGGALRRRYSIGFNLQPTGSSGVQNLNLRGTARYTPGPLPSPTLKTVPMNDIAVTITRN